jgi:hypothetical protein
MPTTDFASEILETEIVLTHIEDGHVFHFPILSNGIVSLRGTRIDANPKAKCEGSSISSTRVTRRRRRSGAHIRRVVKGSPAIADFLVQPRNPVGR